jgi:hypothetical protein
MADTWDLSLFASCPACRKQRIARITAMNAAQDTAASIVCPACSP